MTQVVQAKCPHCKQILRIPSDWLYRPMRCKHCRLTFQARQKPSSATPTPAATRPPLARPAAAPSSPGAPPPVARVVPPPIPGAPAAPSAIPAPQAVPVAKPVAPAGRRPRSRHSSWRKGALIATCVLGIVAVITAVWGQDILELVASPSESNSARQAGILVANAARQQAAAEKAARIAAKKEKARVARLAAARAAREKAERAEAAELMVALAVAEKAAWEMAEKEQAAKLAAAKAATEKAAREKAERDRLARLAAEKAARDKKKKKKPTQVVQKPPVKKDAAFPRRALLISVNNYLFANPLLYGDKSSSTGGLLSDFERFLYFPPSQLTELSDSATGGKAHAPVKPVIEQAITDFLKASRPMDRVVLLFAGHAVEQDKAVYLAPLEGDLNDPKTLIPLTWVYDALVKCPARQKVLILDVCRFDPRRGQERQSTPEMSEVMEAALRKPPAGVQVWASCSAKQRSYELFRGSLFLEALCAVLEHKGLKDIPQPEDPLPMDLLHLKVSEYITGSLKNQKLTQTPRLVGKDPGKGADYDPEQALPPPLVLKPPPLLKDGVADRSLIQGILDEVGDLPPAKGATALGRERLTIGMMPPFSAKIMAKYKADYASLDELDQMLKANPKKYPLRRAVRNATKVLQANAQVFSEVQPGRTIPVPPQEKARIIKYQSTVVGTEIIQLDEALKELKKAGDERDKEKSKRWQANYDYVLIKLTSRLIYAREYSLMLGKIRKDELPELNGAQNGWRLVSVPKLQSTDKEIKELVGDVKDALKTLKKQHAGTPYEILARREQGTSLGLEWRVNGK